MIQELKDMGIELMVSIWPSVDKRSENYEEMLEKGLLVRADRGYRTTMDFMGDTIHYDATNPEAQSYLWNIAKKNYYDKGVKIFWLDEAEPEYTVYDFDIYRYHLGSNLQIGNLYPLCYAKTFYDGMTAANPDNPNILNLLRCAWAGSQKYGALVWSGDVASSWSSLRSQVSAGLHMGLAGIPWWTTDIGGFHGGDPNDPAFRELFVRWFQWGTFCPVMRLHGDREPRQPQHGTTGGAECCSGAANEVWSYGEEIYEICKRYILLRESLRDYTRELMTAAHKKGTPVMRPCFYEFPGDESCWDIHDQYMFGHRYLCAPVLHPGSRSRSVYFPLGTSWKSFDESQVYQGGTKAEVDAPLETMPVFVRDV
jgi:alpha-D-xyloside xylohydrolase